MLLRNIPLFANLSDTELAQISAEASLKQFPKNKVILSDGEKSDSLYAIVAGKVKVLISDEDGKEIILAILGPGEFFGEMSVIDSQPRSATVITMESSSFNEPPSSNHCTGCAKLAPSKYRVNTFPTAARISSRATASPPFNSPSYSSSSFPVIEGSAA